MSTCCAHSLLSSHSPTHTVRAYADILTCDNALRSSLLAPLRRGICRYRSEPGVDLSIHPHHPCNCSLNGKERTFRHSEVCRLLFKLLHKASPKARVALEPRDAGTRYPDIAVVEDSETYHVDVFAQSSSTAKGAAASFMERTEGLLEYITRDCPYLLSFFKGELSLLLARSEGKMRLHTQSLLL